MDPQELRNKLIYSNDILSEPNKLNPPNDVLYDLLPNKDNNTSYIKIYDIVNYVKVYRERNKVKVKFCNTLYDAFEPETEINYTYFNKQYRDFLNKKYREFLGSERYRLATWFNHELMKTYDDHINHEYNMINIFDDPMFILMLEGAIFLVMNPKINVQLDIKISHFTNKITYSGRNINETTIDIPGEFTVVSHKLDRSMLATKKSDIDIDYQEFYRKILNLN